MNPMQQTFTSRNAMAGSAGVDMYIVALIDLANPRGDHRGAMT
jgi:hypothetical protein